MQPIKSICQSSFTAENLNSLKISSTLAKPAGKARKLTSEIQRVLLAISYCCPSTIVFIPKSLIKKAVAELNFGLLSEDFSRDSKIVVYSKWDHLCIRARFWTESGMQMWNWPWHTRGAARILWSLQYFSFCIFVLLAFSKRPKWPFWIFRTNKGFIWSRGHFHMYFETSKALLDHAYTK